jgi:AcrR family transcriptional regulator
VNIAAVNYYFRDKLQLYRTVLQTITGRLVRLLEAHCALGTAEERLRQFVRCILMVERGADRFWAYQLMAREIAELHEAQAELIVEATRPMHEIAEAIVRDLCGAAACSRQVKLAASLLVSLCVNRVPQQRLDQRLSPEIDFKANDIEQTSEQIYQFALAGILGLAAACHAHPGTPK